VAVDPACDVLERGALHQRRRTTGNLDALDPTAHASPSFVKRLAVLGCDDPGQLLEVLLERSLELVEHLRARVHRSIPPPRKRRGRGVNGGADIGGCRKGRATDHVAHGRIVDVVITGRAGYHPAAADEIVEGHDVHSSCDVSHAFS